MREAREDAALEAGNAEGGTVSNRIDEVISCIWIAEVI
mgnify:CR=1 FL=1